MSESASTTAGYRRHGLYYPYFHVRNERWLKVAALYWPKIVRIVPDGYRTNDSDVVRALSASEFIARRPPGSSVQAISSRFIDLVTGHADELRSRFRVTSGRAAGLPSTRDMDEILSHLLHDTTFPAPTSDASVNMTMPLWGSSASGSTTYLGALRLWEKSSRTWLTAVHVSQMSPELRDALVDAQLAARGNRDLDLSTVMSSVDGDSVHQFGPGGDSPAGEEDQWILMHPQLVGVYTSVLAEDFALANHLQPTTDQDDAYAVTNNWTADRIAAVLLDSPGRPSPVSPDELPEALGFLALELVVPPDLDRVPVNQIIEIRERYGTEFFAFGQAVDEAAAALADLSGIRDKAVLEDYLHQAVEVRFAQPLDELQGKMKHMAGDAAAMSINVKTQLPAAVAIAGGAWLTGQPLLAGTGGLALGLIGIRREIRRQRDAVLKSDPAASFLLHTDDRLRPRALLRRTLERFERIAGINAG
jgi:Family of unknown function (DUF6236)